MPHAFLGARLAKKLSILRARLTNPTCFTRVSAGRRSTCTGSKWTSLFFGSLAAPGPVYFIVSCNGKDTPAVSASRWCDTLLYARQICGASTLAGTASLGNRERKSIFKNS